MSDPGTPSQSQEVFRGDLLPVRVETISSPSGQRSATRSSSTPTPSPSSPCAMIPLGASRRSRSCASRVRRSGARRGNCLPDSCALKSATSHSAPPNVNCVRRPAAYGADLASARARVFLARIFDRGDHDLSGDRPRQWTHPHPAIPISSPSSGCPLARRWSVSAPDRSRMAKRCWA